MSAVDVAMITKLQGAPAVTSAAPGGVYWDVAPEGVDQPFVIINLQQHDDAYEMGDGHSEDGRYLVKAVGLGSNATAVAVAASAIHAALQDQPLIVPGYDLMMCHREERIPGYVEIDGATRYQHRGGIYLVGVSQ